MNKTQTAALLDLIKDLFPNFLREDINKVAVFELWHDCLKDCEYDEVIKNLKEYCKENKFPPTISDVYVKTSKYPGHASAKPILEKIERFKEEAKGVKPPDIDIRKILYKDEDKG